MLSVLTDEIIISGLIVVDNAVFVIIVDAFFVAGFPSSHTKYAFLSVIRATPFLKNKILTFYNHTKKLIYKIACWFY